MNKRIWLFNGDSVTDCSRNRLSHDLGKGYVHLISQVFPNITIYNRGISGDRIPDLMKRIDQEIDECKPDLLSILIGINDLWHYFLFGTEVTLTSFKKNYKEMLIRIRQNNPNLDIIIIEPFAFPIEHIDPQWMPQIKSYQKVVKDVADSLHLLFVPMQTYLNQELANYEMKDILVDGVHPTLTGHQLITKHLLPILNKKAQ